MTARRTEIDVVSCLPFAGVHAACLPGLWTGVSNERLSWSAPSHTWFGCSPSRPAITGVSRTQSFKTGRAFQLALAWMGASAVQKVRSGGAPTTGITMRRPIATTTRIRR